MSRRMSNIAKPCSAGCGMLIYFDSTDPQGRTPTGKWVPLEYVDNQRTGQPHNCPKRSNGTQQKQQQQKPILEQVTEESVQKGITAFKLFSDLCLEVDGISIDVNATRTGLERLENKVDKVLELLQEPQQKEQRK